MLGLSRHFWNGVIIVVVAVVLLVFDIVSMFTIPQGRVFFGTLGAISGCVGIWIAVILYGVWKRETGRE